MPCQVLPEQQLHVREAVLALLAEQPGLVMKEGKMVYELRTAIDWDKGKAVRSLLEQTQACMHGVYAACARRVCGLCVSLARRSRGAALAIGHEETDSREGPMTRAADDTSDLHRRGEVARCSTPSTSVTTRQMRTPSS